MLIYMIPTRYWDKIQNNIFKDYFSFIIIFFYFFKIFVDVSEKKSVYVLQKCLNLKKFACLPSRNLRIKKILNIQSLWVN